MGIDVNVAINALAEYGIKMGLIESTDKVFVINSFLDALGITEYNEPTENIEAELEEILKTLVDDAVNRGVIEDSIIYKDLLDTKLMGIMTPFPREVIKTFWDKYSISPEDATNWYYDFSQNTDYIRRYRIKKDVKWVSETEYGDLDITINLSKPEKDPKAIAAAKLAPQSGYPKCLLCKDNVGYAGGVNHPARQNHRVMPMTIANSDWFMQYSPYVYYNEHCIAFNGKHVPMKVDRAAFCKMFDFIKIFPHYFIGSNADLPIVGGSILSHDHFQGGRYKFAMEKANSESFYKVAGFEDVDVSIIKWPMSVIRISHSDSERLIELADYVLKSWRGYTDEEAFIFAETDGEPHNTITPIARKRGEKFEMDLVLRNNITTEENPLGVYHPHAELHHIKKENIGLIEVMGLAVLPSRLKEEMSVLCDKIVKGEDLFADERTQKHAKWANEFMANYDITADNVEEIVRSEIGKVFAKVLEDAGVYKRTVDGLLAFERFITSIGGKKC